MVYYVVLSHSPCIFIQGPYLPLVLGAPKPRAFWVQYYQRINLPSMLKCQRGRCLATGGGKRDLGRGRLFYVLLTNLPVFSHSPRSYIPRSLMLLIPQAVLFFGTT